jgi:hypothetical protein
MVSCRQLEVCGKNQEKVVHAPQIGIPRSTQSKYRFLAIGFDFRLDWSPLTASQIQPWPLQ